MINRPDETEALNLACQNGEAAFVAVYGRRRVGKTYFIRHFLEANAHRCIVFQFTGLLRTKSIDQVPYFARAVKKWLAFEPSGPVESWKEAFFYLEDALDAARKKEPDKRVVVFIDELPWVAQHKNSGFLGPFAHFYNEYIERTRSVLIVCGSAASWMIDNVIKDSGQLYGRVTKPIRILPFTLAQTREYLTQEKGFHVDEKTVCEIYMATGGVAKYLSYFDASRSVGQNMQDLFFSNEGSMVGEYDEIVESLFGLDGLHGRILEALFTRKSGMTLSDIAATLGTNSGGQTSRPLEELLESGFVLKILRLHTSGRQAHYRLADPFCLFYYHWMQGLTRNAILRLPSNHFDSIYGSARWNSWAGYAFENVCHLHLPQYLHARGIAGVGALAYYWNYKPDAGQDESGTQIDLVVERENNTYDIVECKYYNAEFEITKTYADNIRNKVETFKRHGMRGKQFDIKVVILTTYGTKMNKHYNALGISKNMTIGDLFSF